MLSLVSINYLSRKPLEVAMRDFSRNFKKNEKILDIGCGSKPYQKFFKCKYIGLDKFENSAVDIVSDAWNIPCADNEFDGVVLNQSLEHIQKTAETINEIKRILKPGGLCIITAPQTMKNHSEALPSLSTNLKNFDKNKIKYWNYDYYRFTKFGLIYLFRDFQVLEIKETTGYMGTIFQLFNYFLHSFHIPYIFIPFIVLNNFFGIIIDIFFRFIFFRTNVPIFNKAGEQIYNSLTLNYVMIVKK